MRNYVAQKQSAMYLCHAAYILLLSAKPIVRNTVNVGQLPTAFFSNLLRLLGEARSLAEGIMREANYCLPLERTPSSSVLYGVARGLEDLFPVGDYPRFYASESDEDGQAESHTDEAEGAV